jgi:hypothetical protein
MYRAVVSGLEATASGVHLEIELFNEVRSRGTHDRPEKERFALPLHMFCLCAFIERTDDMTVQSGRVRIIKDRSDRR